MTIAVCIVTRNHPIALTGVLMGLHRLSSGKVPVKYWIGSDVDDFKTTAAMANINEHVAELDFIHDFTGSRPVARGEVENRLLSHVRETDASAVTFLTDRTFCITPNWDEFILKGATEQPKRPLWWSCPQDNVCAIPIIPRAWLEACDWKWSPEIFPFWFDDTWHQHIDIFINGMPSLKNKVAFSGQRGKTTRGRDFGFWIDVFWKLLPIRVQQAKDMAAKLGVEWKDRPEVLTYTTSWYEQMKSGVDTLEKTFGDPRDSGPEYAEAKRRAEQMMIDILKADISSAMEKSGCKLEAAQ